MPVEKSGAVLVNCSLPCTKFSQLQELNSVVRTIDVVRSRAVLTDLKFTVHCMTSEAG